MKEFTRIITLTLEVTKKGALDPDDIVSKEECAERIKAHLEESYDAHVVVTKVQDFIKDGDGDE